MEPVRSDDIIKIACVSSLEIEAGGGGEQNWEKVCGAEGKRKEHRGCGLLEIRKFSVRTIEL